MKIDLKKVASAVERLERRRWNPGLESDSPPSYRYRVAGDATPADPEDADRRRYPPAIGQGCRAGFYHRDFLH